MPTEVWMRGAIDGIAPQLQPVAHSLLQVREELEALLPSLSPEALAARPAGIASIGYHALHLAGSIDRLFTYARGRALNTEQLVALGDESEEGDVDGVELLAFVVEHIERAMAELREWTAHADRLFEAREVGRKRLPSTVIGLLFHAAEHAQRHAGQIATTARVVRGEGRDESEAGSS